MNWKDMIRHSVTTSEELAQYMPLSAAQKERLDEILDHFPMRVTPYYLSLIDWDHYQTDPIFRLCIPSIEETDLGGSFDTSGEAGNTRMQGLQHKYRQTALVLTTQACAMYCRHCFRKRLVGLKGQKETAVDPRRVCEYILEHPEINNVLLSGGDSFMMDNAQIRQYLEFLSDIPHLDLIRFGTRTPVTLPMRIYEDGELLHILREYNQKKQIMVVTHFDHPKEITPEAIRAVKSIAEIGIPIRNQAVLLRGVNDDSEVLGTLLRKLTSIGVIPYYVFQCRPVTGVKRQFQVPILEGYRIVQGAMQMQNGQGKSIRYAMSHPTGKIEFIGPLPGSEDDGVMIMKYQQAKDEADAGRIFTMTLEKDQCWIGDIPR